MSDSERRDFRQAPRAWPAHEWFLVLFAGLLAVAIGFWANAGVVGPRIARLAPSLSFQATVWILNLLWVLVVALVLVSVRRGSRRAWIPKLSLSFVTASFLLGLLAYADEVRLVGLQRQQGGSPSRAIRLREHRPNLDERRRPTADALAGSDDLPDREVRFRTDENGFILPTGNPQVADHTIVFLGGSTTECLWVDESLRFPHLVGVRLSERTGRAVSSLNGGVSGNHSLHSLDILLNKVLPLRPDTVPLMHNVNDMVTLIYAGSYWNDHPDRSLVHTATSTGELGALPGTSLVFPRFVGHLERACERLRDRDHSPGDEWASYRNSKLQRNQPSIEREFRRALRTFVAVCRIYETTPVLMTEASRLTPTPDAYARNSVAKAWQAQGVTYAEFQRLHSRLNDAIREVGRDQGVTVIDLAEKIPADGEHFSDLVHFTDRGSVMAAEIIARELLPLVEPPT
ncbi:MAG TPA: SGNH/GDSL hydrolase family protein [Thermoguttaceae bacterium]|nr:SGNH/GDSL hydrolase family protein [Thermoguttaceae bacterium]